MEAAIQIQNVWKIFGNTSNDALDAIQNKKISKQEALEKYNSVIGVLMFRLMLIKVKSFVLWDYLEAVSQHL